MRVLINRSDAIGDTVLTLPVIESLKKENPYCTIGLVVSPRSFDFLKLYKKIDYLFVVNPNDSFFKRLKDWFRFIWEFQPSHYFYVGGDRLGNLACWLKRVSYRGGLRSKFSSFIFLNRSTRQSRSREQIHESLQNIELFSDVISSKKLLVPTLEFESKKREEVKKEIFENLFRLSSKSNNKLFVVHPGMSGHSPNWPMQSYAQLIESLDTKFNKEVFWLISYTPGDQRYVEEFKSFIKHSLQQESRLVYFDGSQEGLEYYCYVLSLADAFIGPSTGTTHLASLIGLPVWSFYSPYPSQSPRRWAPISLNEENLHIYAPETDFISQENARDEKTSYDVLKKIQVAEVSQSIENFFGEKRDEVN